MNLEFLAQADAIAVRFEKAKRNMEACKAELDSAKAAFDELVGRADEHGIPKAKLKKLTEERVQSLIEAGMIPVNGEAVVAAPVKDKPKKSKKKIADQGTAEALEAEAEAAFEKGFDEASPL